MTSKINARTKWILLAAIAAGCGVTDASTARTVDEFAAAAERTMAGDGLSFVVAKVERLRALGAPANGR